jgi:hypothetical protein
MKNRVRAHIRSNIVGYIALFLVVAGGTAYAANTISSADIINGEVKTPDLALDSVITSRIAVGAVATSDLRLDAVNGARVADDSLSARDIVNAPSGSDAVNADKLDGLDSAEVTRGHSQVLHSSVAPPSAGTNSGDLIEVPGFGTVAFDCNSTGQVAVAYTNDRNFVQFVVEDGGDPNPSSYRLAPSATTTQTTHVDADAVTYHVSNGLVETAVIMVAGQSYEQPGFPFQKFCTLQATAISRLP